MLTVGFDCHGFGMLVERQYSWRLSLAATLIGGAVAGDGFIVDMDTAVGKCCTVWEL